MEAKDKKSKKKVESEEERSSDEEEEEEEETFDKSPAMLDKYKSAAQIANEVMKFVIGLCIPGADISEVCVKGDRKIEEAVGTCATRGVGFQGLHKQEVQGHGEGNSLSDVH